MELRDYQIQVMGDIHAAWRADAINVCVQLATGAGKTVIFSRILAEHIPNYGIAIAHRVELVSQISLTLARNGVRHNIIAQKSAIREIVSVHMHELGMSFYDPLAHCYVAGVDTLIRLPPDTPWFKKITLVVQDEGHHVLKDNKWGKASKLFPNAKGLYPTATPCRADGRGLSRKSDGIMDALIIGPPMRDLIKRGYLTDYRIFAPPSDIDLTHVPVGASGDYSPPKLRTAVHKSHIVGDVVAHYLNIACGKLGVTFAVDISAATEIAAEFNAQGVPAEVISSKTPDLLRSQIMSRFRKRQILQLVNVDLLGEGVDVPAIEVISMARPTQSYALYSQQFGRTLRPMEGKTHAIIIDHVGNVVRHGLPDAPRHWALDRNNKRAKSAINDFLPLRTCGNISCLGVYPRINRICPYCGFYTAPVERSTPDQVDGDLIELDPEVLARLRGEIKRIDGPPRIPQRLDPVAQLAVSNRHKTRINSQRELREIISLWAGIYKHQGETDSMIYRRFYFRFKIDIATAQTLGANDADALWDQVRGDIDEMDKSRYADTA